MRGAVRRPALLAPVGSLVMLCATVLVLRQLTPWNARERETLQSLSLASLPPLPPDPSNRVADDPRAVGLGHGLFFDTRLSSNGGVACASCHQPARNFTDGLPLARGLGRTSRKTMTVVGTAYSPWLFWDGRKDSLWSQALGPLESSVEHASGRMQVARVVAGHYGREYRALFGTPPDFSDTGRFPAAAGPAGTRAERRAWERMREEDREQVTRVFVNAGKAIAAYERRLRPAPSRFDRYVRAVLEGDRTGQAVLSRAEVAGVRLFVGKAGCTGCHSGPLFTNNDFHNTGVPARPGLPRDLGRALGARQVVKDEFGCLSPSSDAKPVDCPELRFLKTDGHELAGAFRVPTLRNVAGAAPYMHAGQFATLREVVEHYNRAPEAPAGRTELAPLGLSEREMDQLVAFLETLGGGVDAPPELLRAPPGRGK